MAALWALGKLVPWQVWAVIGLGVALLAGDAYFHVWLAVHDHKLEAEVSAAVKKERDDFWGAREDASNAAHEKALAVLQLKLSTSLASARAAAAKHARDLAAAQLARDAAQESLANRRSLDVTAEAARMCTLTRGVVLHFNEGAACANGDLAACDRRTAGSADVAVNEPAGVSLDTYTAGVERTQDALSTCRAQVAGWQSYHATVIAPWIASMLEALQLCSPKGSP